MKFSFDTYMTTIYAIVFGSCVCGIIADTAGVTEAVGGYSMYFLAAFIVAFAISFLKAIESGINDYHKCKSLAKAKQHHPTSFP